MAKLIDPQWLYERDKPTMVTVELRDFDALSTRVFKPYDEAEHGYSTISKYFGTFYDEDDMGRTWRVWDGVPTAKERRAATWRE